MATTDGNDGTRTWRSSSRTTGKGDSARFSCNDPGSDGREKMGMEELDISVDDTLSPLSTYITVAAPHRSQIDAVFEVFDRHAPESVEIPKMVFIGHGVSRAWRDLDDHIRAQHGCEIEIIRELAAAPDTELETCSNSGGYIRTHARSW